MIALLVHSPDAALAEEAGRIVGAQSVRGE
jgi:hypothetical protein